MSNLSANVKWRKFIAQSQAGHIHQTQAVSAPSKYHAEIIEAMSRIILGSYRPSHPDLLIIGTPDKPPSIGDPEKPNYEGTCRWLIENIALKPMEAPRRLAVIQNAGKLSRPSANSLLKLTEEPPSHAFILFMMDNEVSFLPTLRSRSALTVITEDEEIQPSAIPADPKEWVDCLSSFRSLSATPEMILSSLENWEEYAIQEGNFDLSCKIDRLRTIAFRKNLSLPALTDLVIMALMEENLNIANILDNIR